MRATSGQLTPCLYSAAGKNSMLPMKGLGVTDKAIASPDVVAVTVLVRDSLD
jgi:hypothetical protein